jgi:hypothetical protein
MIKDPVRVVNEKTGIIFYFKRPLSSFAPSIRHRTDGPAAIFIDGDERWYQHGKLHREDGPAVIEVDGSEHWYIEGVKCVGK